MHKIGYYSCHSKSRSLTKALCEELPLFQSTEKKNQEKPKSHPLAVLCGIYNDAFSECQRIPVRPIKVVCLFGLSLVLHALLSSTLAFPPLSAYRCAKETQTRKQTQKLRKNWLIRAYYMRTRHSQAKNDKSQTYFISHWPSMRLITKNMQEDPVCSTLCSVTHYRHTIDTLQTLHFWTMRPDRTRSNHRIIRVAENNLKR